jgi:hypothetical protein
MPVMLIPYTFFSAVPVSRCSMESVFTLIVHVGVFQECMLFCYSMLRANFQVGHAGNANSLYFSFPAVPRSEEVCGFWLFA